MNGLQRPSISENLGHLGRLPRRPGLPQSRHSMHAARPPSCMRAHCEKTVPASPDNLTPYPKNCPSARLGGCAAWGPSPAFGQQSLRGHYGCQGRAIFSRSRRLSSAPKNCDVRPGTHVPHAASLAARRCATLAPAPLFPLQGTSAILVCTLLPRFAPRPGGLPMPTSTCTLEVRDQRIAALAAVGLRQGEIARRMGLHRNSVWRRLCQPQVQAQIAEYRRHFEHQNLRDIEALPAEAVADATFDRLTVRAGQCQPRDPLQSHQVAPGLGLRLTRLPAAPGAAGRPLHAQHLTAIPPTSPSDRRLRGGSTRTLRPSTPGWKPSGTARWMPLSKGATEVAAPPRHPKCSGTRSPWKTGSRQNKSRSPLTV